jgi:hypothetical protein
MFYPASSPRTVNLATKPSDFNHKMLRIMKVGVILTAAGFQAEGRISPTRLHT